MTAPVDTTALSLKHPSRVRGNGWVGPNELVARFGRDAALGEWLYGFRLAIKTDLGNRLVRAWSIVPAPVNERDLTTDLLATGPPARPAPRQRLRRPAVCRRPGHPGHRRARRAHQGPTRPHAPLPGASHRLLAQPRGNQFRRAH
ncbi:hypothetical protein [Geodermatophilus sp. URMC 64]